MAGAPVEGEDEDNPQPSKRHRQVSNIIGYEDDWDTAAVQAQTSSKGKQLKYKQLQEQLEDDSADSDQPAAGQKRRLSKAGSQDIQDVATTPAAKRKRAGISDDDHKASIQPRRSSRQHAGGGDRSTEDQPGPPNVAHLLAEEGLDPVERGMEGTQLAGRRKPSKIGLGSIRDRMQQNQQRLHAVCGWKLTGSLVLHPSAQARLMSQCCSLWTLISLAQERTFRCMHQIVFCATLAAVVFKPQIGIFVPALDGTEPCL